MENNSNNINNNSNNINNSNNDNNNSNKSNFIHCILVNVVFQLVSLLTMQIQLQMVVMDVLAMDIYILLVSIETVENTGVSEFDSHITVQRQK